MTKRAQPPEDGRCAATSKQTGQRCKNAPIPGGTVCRFHGGGTKQAKAAAAARLTEQAATEQVARLGARKDIHPIEALLDLVHWTAGEVDYWRAQVVALEDGQLVWGTTSHREGTGPEGPVDVTTDEAKPHVAYVMLERSSDRLAAYSAAALKAGVDERRVALAEHQGKALADVIRRILDQLDLSDEQAMLVGTVVPQELRRLGERSER